MSRVNDFTASDKFVALAQSLIAMLTTMRVKYGSVAEMVEHATWNGSKLNTR
jgi:hypothetical protein